MIPGGIEPLFAGEWRKQPVAIKFLLREELLSDKEKADFIAESKVLWY